MPSSAIPPALADGRAQYSMIVAPDGGIIDDLIVYRLAPDRFLVVANASNARTVSDALAERLAGFKAILDDRSLATALVAIQGPRSVEIVRPLTDVDLDALRYYAIAEGSVAGIPALVARTGYTGEDGFEVFVDTARAVELWDAMMAAGADHGLAPIGLGARDTLRLEAGMPLYGNELDRATNPYEANLGRVVKLDKDGDFVGRAALEKVAREGVARQLVGLVMRGRGHRPPWLPGPRRRAGHRLGHERHPVAVAGRGDRDGLRRHGRRRAGYDDRRRDPRSAGPRRSRRPAVLSPATLRVARSSLGSGCIVRPAVALAAVADRRP